MPGAPTFHWGQSTVTVAQGETVTVTADAMFVSMMSYSVGDSSIATATPNSEWTSWTIQGISTGSTTVTVEGAENGQYQQLTITVTGGDDENFLNERGLTHFWENIDSIKQDKLVAGSHINITDSTIKAVDYVHSDNPVSTSQVTPVVTNSMIANGTITADKLASGATVKLTLSTSDIGEGAALAANTLYGVYQ